MALTWHINGGDPRVILTTEPSKILGVPSSKHPFHTTSAPFNQGTPSPHEPTRLGEIAAMHGCMTLHSQRFSVAQGVQTLSTDGIPHKDLRSGDGTGDKRWWKGWGVGGGAFGNREKIAAKKKKE